MIAFCSLFYRKNSLNMQISIVLVLACVGYSIAQTNSGSGTGGGAMDSLMIAALLGGEGFGGDAMMPGMGRQSGMGAAGGMGGAGGRGGMAGMIGNMISRFSGGRVSPSAAAGMAGMFGGMGGMGKNLLSILFSIIELLGHC